ncbi:MAG TPA: hydantoinase B/oxoprolinase family protein [Methylomirabilota bacterium]|nr:hydantoinase B/oxoprolinase family protein [Methylomirabilota bacterium]
MTPEGPRRLRIGIDTGGTFTDVVAVDEATGELFATKTPSIPEDRSLAVLEGLRKVLRLAGAPAGAVAAVSHGTTVATNALLEERFDGLALVTTEGFRHVLEIARQSVPQGYGNSYFWVKPEQIVPLQRVREVPERLSHRGDVLRELDEAAAAEVARWCRRQGIWAIGVSFVHGYANPAHEQRMREILAREHPEAHVSLSSEVWPEYREYERTVTTLVDAFAKGRVSGYVERIGARLAAELGPGVPFQVMKSNGGVISAREVVSHPITTILSGPAAGALGAAFLASAAGFDRILTMDAGGTSTDVCLVEGGEPGLTTAGAVGRFPVKVPMIDLVTVGTGGGSIAWRAPEGGLRVGPASAGADPGPMCYGRGGTRPTVTDAQLVLGRIPPRLLGGEVPLSVDLARKGIEALAADLDLTAERTAEGVLEIAAWNQANAVEQMSVKRGLDPRDYTLVAFGGSGPLLAGRLVDLLGLRGALIPASPGTVSAFGLLTVDLKNDYVQTSVERHARLDLTRVNGCLARLEARAVAALVREGVAESARRLVRLADLRYFGQAWEVTVELPPGEIDAARAAETVERFHAAHEKRYGYGYRTEGPGLAGSRQGVEWVNLRVVGMGLTERPTLRASAAGDGNVERARTTTRAVAFDGRVVECPLYDRARLQAGDRLTGPAIVEEFGATTVVFPGQRVEVDWFANLLLTRLDAATAGERAQPERAAASADPSAGPGIRPDPIVLQIVQGTLASVEAEVEAAIERTARSPMIREARDFRAGIHDRHCRKLTGRSYSSLVQPVVRDFPLETMRPGDVYFHNDVYESEGGIGHLPDLCVTVPVFDPCQEDRVVAFVQAFGHHDDIGGAVPGSMPSRATSAHQEGLMVPPVKLYDAGRPNRDVMRILVRNSRLPDSLRADLDSEVAACRLGAARLGTLFRRYGAQEIEACFEAILRRTTETFRRELLARIPDGTHVWEDYAEHDGVDPPRLHAQRITMTKAGDRLILDFAGTTPQAKGPINHAGDYADGVFLKKWLAPILRNLADTPERMAELDVNEGVVPLIELRFPPPGTLLTPVFPAPTNARTFVILRLLGVLAGVLAKATGGRMPADQETIRYTGFHGTDSRGEFYLMREVLGGGSGGRYYADGSDVVHIVPDSKNLPVEFTETRFPLRVERLALATDSGGAGRRRGGLGYLKEFRPLSDSYFLSVADRSILACWGLAGGRAGQPFRVTVDPGGPGERVLPGLVDDEAIPAGTLVRVETTGGGGWGDPLEREPPRVVLDVVQGKVSARAAQEEYGVALVAGSDGAVGHDPDATLALRRRLREARRRLPFFDRGPGYRRLAGRAHADVDFIEPTAGPGERARQ